MNSRDKKPLDTELTEDTPDVVANSQNDWASKIMWGALFIGAGVLLLLSSLGVISVDLTDLWKLWPVLIILAGLSILSLRGWVAIAVYGVVMFVIAALAWTVLTGDTDTHDASVSTIKLHISQEGSGVEGLDVSIKGGAGNYSIGSHEGDDVIEGSLSGRSTQFKHTSVVKNHRQSVAIESTNDRPMSMLTRPEEMDIKLGSTLPTSLVIDAGASKIDADLSNIILEKLDINTGASSVNIKLGSLATKTEVDIDTGVSSVAFEVPKNTGVKLYIDGGLNNKDIPSEFTQLDDSSYQSSNYDSATSKIEMRIDMGVSSFRLTLY